ncbi:hypothetical protein GQX73_g8681 [Xylaria multiplex]|uniref:Berberine/berberine-like domain-containing protein n=1 Tax=Xylaria multiplex TaxID=323545 RepID=A0A7C8IP20_9PEZI|nr:hypothetical protein GQX73_g8681 [Xylaria multiplex]
MRISEASEFATELEEFQPMDSFATYSTISFPISGATLSKVHSLWKNATLSVASRHPNLTSVLTFQSIPPPPAANGPQNSLPFTPTSTPHNNVVLTLFSFYWPQEVDSKEIKLAARRLTDSAQLSAGSETKYQYLNYASAWQDPIGSYGTVAKEELRQVAKLYDPTGFFQQSVTGGFKL